MTKTVLAIGTVFPEPNSSAAGQHLLSLLNVFAELEFTIHVASSAQADEASADLTELGYEQHQIHLNCSSFNTFVATLQPDIVIYDRFLTEEQYSWRVREACPKAINILDTEDLHSLRQLRHDIIKRQSLTDVSWPALQALHETHAIMNHPLAMREVASILRSDLSLIISSVEYDILTNCYGIPAAQIHYCPFILPPPNKADEACLPFSERNDFVFIGNYRHAPNWDAVLFLSQVIWPKIRARLPQAQCHIFGAYTPPKAQQCHQPKQGFHIQGFAKDAERCVAQARVQLAPLRFGAGLKGKVFESIRSQTPIVTTDIGIEGIPNVLPHVGLHDEDAINTYVELAVELYTSESRWNHFNNDGLSVVEKYFNATQIISNLKQRVSDLIENISEHRQRNMMQQILTQQQHAAHKYMSQWIEAKQKN